MKILHIVINGEVAGGQIVCQQIIERLLLEGHEALVVSPSEGPFTDRLRKKRIPVFLLPFEKTYSFHRAFQLAGLIKREKVNLVHTHGMVPLNVQARLAARLAKVPCISHIHIANVFNSNPFIRKYQMALDNWTSSLCEKLIAVSESTKRSLVEQGIPSDRIEVVFNGVDPEKIQSVLSREEVFHRFGISSDKRLVGMVGRLCPAKGQDDFLKAVKQVFQQVPNVVWMIVGKDIEFQGFYEKKLRDLAKTLELNGNGVFAGHQDDPLSIINAMEFLVVPSQVEGLPLVILEAMAIGKAVIATRVGGVGELVEDEKTGILLPAGRPELLAEAMAKFLKAPALAVSMGQAGFQRVCKNFTASCGLKRIMELYERSLD